MSELKRTFRPEFLNRVDGTMVFHALNREEIKQIVDLELDKVRERLEEQQVSLEMNEEAKGYLADEGYDPHFGARPLRRIIQNKVEDVLSEGILAGTYRAGDTVLVDYEDGKINMKVTRRAEPAAELAEPEPVA
jgi:ATP-dependent Clp protease ATP-binding subunit ClpC